jgi:hypothetical protein
MSRFRTSGILLILSFLLCMGGVVLFARRQSQFISAFVWERGLIMAGFVAASVGVVVLARALLKARARPWAALGATAFLAGAISVLVAEASLLLESFDVSLEVGPVMVALLFLGQAAIGIALLNSGAVTRWVAWGLIVWNVLLLLGFLIVSPREWYYPGLHFPPLLWIGIPLVGANTALATREPPRG